MSSWEEKTKEETRKEMSYWLFIIGLITSLIGYIVYDFHINRYLITQTGREILRGSEYPYQLGGLLLIIAGIVVSVIGIGKKFYSRA